MTQVPEYVEDIYSDEVIVNPWPVYQHLRNLGPVVYLSCLDNYALTQHADVRQALRDDTLFISSKGVAADEFGCNFLQGNTVASDGERHIALRQAMAPPLLPGALGQIECSVANAANLHIDSLLKCDSFDAITDLARHLPLTIVRELVGLPDFGQERMLKWAGAAFDVLGIQNKRGEQALDAIAEMREFIYKTDTRDALKPGSWTDRIHDLVDNGLLPCEHAPFAIRDYINPSLDTTISATGELIYQLGSNPLQWALLKRKPELLDGAVNEAVRLSTPIRSFCRHASRDTEIKGIKIPKGSRVMLLFASANRDELVFDQPDRFDITRNPRTHVGFGSGVHMCVGMHLAQLEMRELLKAMLNKVESIEVGVPTRAINNTISAYKTLPCKFVKAVGAPESSETTPLTVENKSNVTGLLRAKVSSRKLIGDRIISLQLEPADGAVFPAAKAGAHIDLHLAPALVRQYSLTGKLQAGHYKIAIKLDTQSRGGSVYLHERVHEGSTINVSVPRNNFPLQEPKPEDQYSGSMVYLIAGGIGLTPLLAMAWELHESSRDFELHIYARTESAIPFANEYNELPFRQKLHVHISHNFSEGKIDISSIAGTISRGDQLYVCGPAGFIKQVHIEAIAAGFSERQFNTEYFGAEIDTDGEPFTLVARKSNREFSVPPDKTILQVLVEAGIEVPTACENGVCGSCLLGVVEGTPDHRDMVQTDLEKSNNTQITACCSRSKTQRLVLDI